MDFTYGDCKKEMDMVNKAFIEIMTEGDADGRGFQYPIPTYSITRDFDWSDTENNRLLFEMTAKYGTPYFSNYINSDMEPSDVRSMCCRLRLDLRELRKKSDRIVISTSGWFEDKVVALAKQFPNIGIRISIEGLSCKNDELRGHAGGFDKGLRTLLTLKQMGLKDIGFGCTVSNNNSKDMLSLYQLSLSLGMEFATAAFHNSYYFHKDDNVITNKDEVCKNFEQLIEWQLQENHPKSWFRAWFNMGLINYIEGGRRMLPCEAGSANFFIDPFGEVYPCNGLEEKYWQKSTDTSIMMLILSS